MKMTILAAMAISLALVGSASNAQTLKSNTTTVTPITTVGGLKAASGDQRLKCSGAVGHKTCTSKYAWVCPSGWHACTPPPGGTCCTQN